ncbi:MAG: sigma-70 family RNA polymerase sigma factor [Planctomycetota bacterium]|jgi:RNA polymerase sigma-70 factor (ECF subfamily)
MDEVPHIQQYLRLRHEFMGYLYAITRDADLAEEVYQNAAVVVMERAEQDEGIRDFRAWAKEVVRRQALNALRAKIVSADRARQISPQLLDVISAAFVQDETDVSVVQSEIEALNLCLEQLPDNKRELVALRYEGASSFVDISERVGSTPAAVQRAISRVRKRLHDCVQRRLRLAEDFA